MKGRVRTVRTDTLSPPRRKDQTVELPSLDDVCVTLAALAEVPSIEPGQRVADLGVDSLDLLEWCYTLEDNFGVELQDEVLELIGPDDTLEAVYVKVMAVLQAKLAGPVATGP